MAITVVEHHADHYKPPRPLMDAYNKVQYLKYFLMYND